MQWIFPVAISSNHHRTLFIAVMVLPVFVAVFLPLIVDEYRQYRKERSFVQQLSKKFRHHKLVYKYKFDLVNGEIYVTEKTWRGSP